MCVCACVCVRAVCDCTIKSKYDVNYNFLFPCPQVADGLPGIHKAEILGLCDEVDILSRQLSDLCRRGHGDTPQAQDVARYIK